MEWKMILDPYNNCIILLIHGSSLDLGVAGTTLKQFCCPGGHPISHPQAYVSIDLSLWGFNFNSSNWSHSTHHTWIFFHYILPRTWTPTKQCGLYTQLLLIITANYFTDAKCWRELLWWKWKHWQSKYLLSLSFWLINPHYLFTVSASGFVHCEFTV